MNRLDSFVGKTKAAPISFASSRLCWDVTRNIFVSLVMLCALERAMPSSEPKDSRLHLLAINPKAMTLDRDELEHW
jgi:hypothetical protein